VVLRTPVFELIQYLPRTEAVRAVPVLVVPSLANRHYLADLAPGRSIVEHLVAGGQQVFALSWWNPRAEHAGRGLDDYARAVLDAMGACERITRSTATSLLAVGSGGTVTAALLGHLAAAGSAERAASLTLLLPALGAAEPPAAPPPDPDPAPDLRSWAADTIRVPLALHTDLADIAAREALAHPGAVRVLGTPVDLAKVDADAYVVAGDDGPWPAAYRSARLLAGDTRFVLAPGGPVAALIAPPGRPARSFHAAPVGAAEPAEWHLSAERSAGSWWADHLGWLDERSGARVDAPPGLGGRGLHAIAPTPGDYVLSR
jgi:poly(3-hydroxyalkanoate) synthetase